ncbi:hypothetical protein BDW59DRAFT_161662 [Aspergillus cavernicola]|uniref:Uncharacterized protein n=1 Tax=Aspergillus cavernicola TaxID=176166 RepID=A0ABR4ICG6_9EURO
MESTLLPSLYPDPQPAGWLLEPWTTPPALKHPTRASIKSHIQSLYSGSASESDMAVYAENAIYDGPFSYCDTRYKIAGQWYGIPKLFRKSETLASEVLMPEVGREDEVVWKQGQRQRHEIVGGVGETCLS